MSEIPDDLLYSTDHLWVRRDEGGRTARVGITDHAQNQLGDVLDVTLPDVGAGVEKDAACGDIESTKSLSDLVSPLSGKVVARNEELQQAPEKTNDDPYRSGWLFDVTLEPSESTSHLMDSSAYRELIGE